MKLLITATLGILFAAVSVRADIANYDATVASQDPADELYQFDFNNSLSANVGSGTFTAGANTAYTTDLSSDPNGALSVTANATSGGYTLTNDSFVVGQGTVNSVGTLSFLYNLSTASGTEYFLSLGGDTTSDANAFALAVSSGTFELKIGGHSATLPAPAANEWYYIGITWDFNGTTSDSATYYIGEVGGTLNAPVTVTGYAATSEVGGTTGETGSDGEIVVGNRQALNSGMEGDYGTLATWSSQLTGDEIQAQFNALTTPVPEPSTVALVGAGTMMLFGLRRRIA
jgi:PEP-CTERM motif